MQGIGRRAAAFLAAVALAAAVEAAAVEAKTEAKDAGVYAPYAFLIGEWDVGAEAQGPSFAIARFKWGPGRSYMWYSASFIANGAEEPHFEGLLLWNGVHRNLDMLLSLDLKGGRVQEQGTLSTAADGSVVRDITAYYSEGVGMLSTGRPAPEGGATVHFRQTFKSEGPGRVLTSLLRESGGGWVPTFPGSDHLAMTRRGVS